MLAIPHLIGQRRIPFQYHQFPTPEDLQNFIDSFPVVQQPAEAAQPANTPAKKPVQPSANQPETVRGVKPQAHQPQDVTPNSARNLPQYQSAPTGNYSGHGNINQSGMPVGEAKPLQGNYPRQDPSMTATVTKGTRNLNPEFESGQNPGVVPNRPQVPRVPGVGIQENNPPNSQRSVQHRIAEPADLQLASHRSRAGVNVDTAQRQSSGPSQVQFYQSDWPTDPVNHAAGHFEENQSQNSSDNYYPEGKYQASNRHNPAAYNLDSEFNRSSDMSFSSHQRSMQRGPVENPSRYGQHLHFSPDSQGRSQRHVPGAADSSGSSRVGSEDVASQSLSYSRKQSEVHGPGENVYLEGYSADPTRPRAPQDPRFQHHQGDASSFDGGEGHRPHQVSAQVQEKKIAEPSAVAQARKAGQNFIGVPAGGINKQVPAPTQKLTTKQPSQQPEQETTVRTRSTPKQPSGDSADLENFPMLVPREDIADQQLRKIQSTSSPKEVYIPFKDYEPQFSLPKPEPTPSGEDPLIPELHPLRSLREGFQTEAFLKAEAELQGSQFKSYLTRQHMANTYYLNPDKPTETWNILGGNTARLRRELTTRDVHRNMGQRLGAPVESPQPELKVDDVVQIFSDVHRERAERRLRARMHHEQMRMQTLHFLTEFEDQAILRNVETTFISKPVASRKEGENEGDKSRDGKTNSTTNSQSKSKEPKTTPAF